MADQETRGCSDCDGILQEIIVIDRGHANTTRIQEYAAADAKRSLWTGQLPIAGAVKSYMCSECGLIKSYGVAKE